MCDFRGPLLYKYSLKKSARIIALRYLVVLVLHFSKYFITDGAAVSTLPHATLETFRMALAFSSFLKTNPETSCMMSLHYQ
ncbi:hypothetical protein T4B_2120 [Trichinella pseudospiralis]|uniref:Uncharacterized protein n=1 Tax=Trichinella pseudospiralis TaxID=6337 RepID=A0A0V1IC15_TRIPS|nr:hypothetical protein T4B_10728 [Trichinella pseudospiralis]KRZ27127.1 hypothetical protein T4B_2120 [Trichinella pseudospiralis]